MAGTTAGIAFSPDSIVRRQSASWRGIAAEIVQVTRREPFEYRLCAPFHLLIALDRAERRDGETFVEGLPRSTRHEFSRKLTFVPAGRAFRGWQDPRVLTRATCFYLDPQGPLLDPDLRFGEMDLAPRLYFEEPSLWGTAAKLTAEIERGEEADPFYAEALCVVLLTEIVRLQRGAVRRAADFRGGLAAWQRRAVEDHVEAHLAEPLSLGTLADLIRLSPRHFARAFKQSFGLPPHHYHVARRIEQAKMLLAQPELPVTEIAVALGFADTSTFSATFRKTTGEAPRDYRRRLA
jgi:AraC family transcriptional regulator